MSAISVRKLHERHRRAMNEVERLRELETTHRKIIESQKVTEAGLRDRIRHLSLQIQNLQQRNTHS